MRDNLCKYLAESYPSAFTQWLLQDNSMQVSVLKTELGLEPIRADSVTFVQSQHRILHLEFQVEPQTEPPLPLRMLDYWVRLHRKYACEIVQVLILLKRTTLPVPTEFTSPTTKHSYRVIKLWEEDPQQFLEIPGLLPLAVLGATNNETELLQTVARRIEAIEPLQERRELSAMVQLMAGLQYSKELIRGIFRGELMHESVVYQEILAQGRQEGWKEGKQKGELLLLLRQLKRRFGPLPLPLEAQLMNLSLIEIEGLADAIFDFTTLQDVTCWLEDHHVQS